MTQRCSGLGINKNTHFEFVDFFVQSQRGPRLTGQQAYLVLCLENAGKAEIAAVLAYCKTLLQSSYTKENAIHVSEVLTEIDYRLHMVATSTINPVRPPEGVEFFPVNPKDSRENLSVYFYPARLNINDIRMHTI